MTPQEELIFWQEKLGQARWVIEHALLGDKNVSAKQVDGAVYMVADFEAKRATALSKLPKKV